MMRVTVVGLARTVSFQPVSSASGGDRGPDEAQRARGHVLKGIEAAAIENLKPHQVQVNGMRIVGEIHEFPDFGGAEHRLLGDRHVPGRVVQQHPHGLGHLLVYSSSVSRRVFTAEDSGDPRHGAQGRRQRARIRHLAMRSRETA